MSKVLGFAAFTLTAAFFAFGCAASTDQTGTDDGTSSEDLKGQECGGFVANPKTCPKGYECIAGSIPDLPGHCKKEKGGGSSSGGSTTNDGPTCVTLTCEQGYHCEEKGINGGDVATCIKN
jgi:hypothetical protein